MELHRLLRRGDGGVLRAPAPVNLSLRQRGQAWGCQGGNTGVSEASGIQATCSLLSGAERLMGLEAGCRLAFSPQLACLPVTELSSSPDWLGAVLRPASWWTKGFYSSTSSFFLDI